MSIKLIDAAWAVRLGNGTDKLVLVALADCCNDAGRCWPSLDILMQRTELSNRAIRYSLKRLQQAGHLKVIHRHRHSSLFRLSLAAPGALIPAPDAAHGRHLVPLIPAPGAARTVKDPSSEPSKNLRGEKPLETVLEKQESKEVMHRVIHSLEVRRMEKALREKDP